MVVRFDRSAARHGISSERALFVIETCPLPMYRAGTEYAAQLLFLGPDANGVPLEVVAVETAGDELYVIHAMRLRRSLRDAYAEVMRWRER